MVANSFEGGGTSRPLDQPNQTTISHVSAMPTGSTSPIAGRAQRRRRPDGAGFAIGLACSSAGSSTVMAIARTLLAADCKLANGGCERSWSSPRTRGPITTDLQPPTFIIVPDAAPALSNIDTDRYGSRLALRLAGTTTVSVRRQRNLVVDQCVKRRLDVDLGLDDAGLLQRQTRGEDGFALRRTDPAVGQFGALLELLVDHRVGQSGDRDKGLLQLVVIGERIFARVLVSGEHAAGDIGIILQELFAHIEDAPGVGI